MIAQELTAEMATHLAGVLPSTVTVLEAGDDVDAARPCVVLSTVEVEEFDTLMRGNWWATLQAELTTVVDDTTLANFSSWVHSLECVFQDKEELKGALRPVARRLHEYQPDPSEVETAEGFRVARLRTRVLIEKRGNLKVDAPVAEDGLSASSIYLTASG